MYEIRLAVYKVEGYKHGWQWLNSLTSNIHVTFGTQTICTCVMSSKYDYDIIMTMRTTKLVLMMMMKIKNNNNNNNNNVDNNLQHKT